MAFVNFPRDSDEDILFVDVSEEDSTVQDLATSALAIFLFPSEANEIRRRIVLRGN